MGNPTRNCERRRIIIINHLPKGAMSVFVVLGLLLLAGSSSRGDQHQPRPDTLRVVIVPYLSYAPFFIAEEEGYFADHGLRIEYVRIDSSASAIPTLAQGRLDVVAGTIQVSQLNAMSRGAKIKFVASRGYVARRGCASEAVVARRALVEGGKLDSPARLKGRRIAMPRASASSADYFLETLLNTAGLTLDDVEIVDIPPPAQLEALEKGMVDLTLVGEPWVTRLLQTGHGVLWMEARKVIPDFQWGFILYGPTLLEKNPDAGRRFIIAYLKAARQYNLGKTERNLEILAKHTGLDRELLKQACWPPMREDGRINVKGVLGFQAWSIKKGLLDSPVKEERLWDPSFVEYANRALKTGTR